MMKICAVCGKEYEPYRGTYRKQLTCSEECRQAWRNRYAKKKYVDNRERILAAQREMLRKKKNGHVICKICGRPIFRDWSVPANHGHMHDECIYDDIITTIRSGFKVSKLQKARLYSRGYTLGEFISEYEDELNEAKIN